MNDSFNFYPIDELIPHLEGNRPVLTPNHRLARRIRHAWGRRQVKLGVRAWVTPPVMSIDHWWRHCYGLCSLAGDDLPELVSPSQEAALWLQCVSGGDPTLLRPAAAGELAAQAYRNLLLWEVDWRSPSTAQLFDLEDDGRLFLRWARQFEARLEELGFATLTELIPRLAAACREDSLVLAEFGDLPPCYRKALAVQTSQLLHHRAGKESAACFLQPCESHRGELEAAARWARQQFEDHPDRRIGVLLPGLAQERAHMETLLHREFGSDPRRPDTLPVNFSAGLPLADCGPVKTALGLLALPVRAMNLAQLGHILMSRYRDGGELHLELDAWKSLLEAAKEPVTPATLRYRLGRASGEAAGGSRLHARLLETGERRRQRTRQPPSRWAAAFADQLEALGWPGHGPLDSLEYQQVEEFQNTLARLAELDRVCGDLDYREGLEALEDRVRRSVFQAQTSDAPVQVLGLLEAAGLQFDALWVCNMGAGEWPNAASPNPFIPVSLQRRLQMPHADASRELEYAGQLLAHLRQSCGELIASYVSQDEAVPLAPTGLLADAPRRAVWRERPWPDHWPTEPGRAGLEAVEHGGAPPVTDEEAGDITGGSGILANQAQCPFRAFAVHRLNARPFPVPEVALTASERGSILHDAMNVLWGKLECRERLAATLPTALRQICAECAGVAVETFSKRHGMHASAVLLELEKKRLEALLMEWLDVEMERADFIVRAREQRHAFTLGPLSITLRIDRVDELADGRKLVIDYKSSDSKIKLWLGERPEDPQLPLYAQMLDGDGVAGIGFAVLRPPDIGYRGLADGEPGPGFAVDIAGVTKDTAPRLDDWAALQAHWKQVLTSLGQEFLDGRSSVAPIDRRRTCRYCGLEPLCRVR